MTQWQVLDAKAILLHEQRADHKHPVFSILRRPEAKDSLRRRLPLSGGPEHEVVRRRQDVVLVCELAN